VDPKQTQNVLVPAIAIAALIAVAGLVLYVGNPDPKPTTGTKPASAAQEVAATAEGMSATVPPADSPEWKLADQGLKVWDVTDGTGDPCKPGANVVIHYTGWLTDGTKFDSSLDRGQPANFNLNGLIEGWKIGIPGMKPGGVRRLLVPAAIGYGAGGSPPTIPGGATLVFEVKLISWTK
jgi:FKBP-type peptidyl-prolyl cis-trans isomerase FkpA